MAIPSPCLLYHFVHVDNVPAILEAEGLLCKRALQSSGTASMSIASEEIQARRAQTRVPLGGTLHDYVPFYFAPRSPMLFRIFKGGVKEYSGSQEDLVYLVSSVERIEAQGLRFAFTLGHAIVAPLEFRIEATALGDLDWGVLRARYWRDTERDNDRERRRQAEFLVRDRVPLAALLGFAAFDVARVAQVAHAVAHAGATLRGKPRPDWYF